MLCLEKKQEEGGKLRIGGLKLEDDDDDHPSLEAASDLGGKEERG